MRLALVSLVPVVIDCAFVDVGGRFYGNAMRASCNFSVCVLSKLFFIADAIGVVIIIVTGVAVKLFILLAAIIIALHIGVTFVYPFLFHGHFIWQKSFLDPKSNAVDGWWPSFECIVRWADLEWFY